MPLAAGSKLGPYEILAPQNARKKGYTMVAQETQQTEGPETSAPLAEPQPEGSPEEDWFRAEEELLARSQA